MEKNMRQHICSFGTLVIENAGTHLRIQASLTPGPAEPHEQIDLAVVVPGGADKSLQQLNIALLDRALELISATRAHQLDLIAHSAAKG